MRLRRLLAESGAALHPALALAPAERRLPTGGPPVARVLFLCTGNSARSQMAEVLLADRAGGAVEVGSAGSHPKPLHPTAVRVVRERFGLDLSGCEPKHLDVFAGQSFDRVVTLCDRVKEVCPGWPGPPEVAHWSLADPSAAAVDEDDDGPFHTTADELEERIGLLLAALLPPEE